MKDYLLFALMAGLLTAAFISAFVYNNSVLAVLLAFITLLPLDKWLPDDKPKQKAIAETQTDEQEFPKISSPSIPVSSKKSRGLSVPPPLN